MGKDQPRGRGSLQEEPSPQPSPGKPISTRITDGQGAGLPLRIFRTARFARGALRFLAATVAALSSCCCATASEIPESAFGERWFAVMLRDARVGYMRVEVLKRPSGRDEAVCVDTKTVMSFSHPGGKLDVVSESSTAYAAGAPSGFLRHRSTSLSGGSRTSISIDQDGPGHLVRIERGGAIEETRRVFRQTLPEDASEDLINRFSDAFNGLIFHFLGASSCQAQILGMNPRSREYAEWVTKTMGVVFLPLLKEILFHKPADSKPNSTGKRSI